MQLYKHQERVLELNPEKYLLAHGMGSGKTITALALAKKNNVVALVVCPKPVRKKWNKAMVDMGVDGEVITREQFRKLAPKLHGSKFQALIIDEAHYGFSNQKSQLAKKTMWFIKEWDIKYIWLLTGTPYTSSPFSVYGLALLLGHKWNYFDFRGRFFREQWFGSRSVWVPRTDEGAREELARCVRLIGSVVRLDECVDVPDQIVEVETFEKNKEQEQAESHIQADESNPLVRTTKYHQIASGVQIGTEFTGDLYYECEKNDRIMEYAEETPKLIVFSRYNIHLNLLKKMLDEKKIPCAIVNGKTDDKEAIFDEAEKSERFVLLINASCSVGYELPTFDTVVFASLSYSFVDYTQAMGRVLRINALKKNLYIVMVTEGSVDEAVWLSIQNKRDFNDTIFSSTELQAYES
jgi:SNF2 family DNA or RNA helicase